LAAGVDGQERWGEVTSQYCGQRVDVLLRGSTSDEEEKGIWVGDWKDSRKARLIMSCRHSAGGLQFPGFWNGRSPPNSISRRRRCQCKQTTAETTRHDTKRGLVEGSVQTLRASRAIPWASSVPGSRLSATVSLHLLLLPGAMSHWETSVASLMAVEVVQARQQEQGRCL
jgi:hypothetical protein